ncbi:MAG TPA: ATP-binding protein, partial [Ktedonobacteraceae bacterium]|nr:ATP-binding protein [Ktedonobacteraceae bacterium]
RSTVNTPEWLPSPWNSPLIGFICAILVPVLSILLSLLLKQIFLSYVFPATLIIIAMVIVAFLWGTGPGLLATLWGTVLFNVIVLSPQYPVSLSAFQNIFETCFLLAIGTAMSLLAIRIERARSEAVAAHLEIEKLVTQLEEEKEALSEAQQLATKRASEMEAFFEAMADGVYVYDSQGHLIRTNAAAEAFNPLLGQSEYLSQPFLERISTFDTRNERMQQLEVSNLPLIRVLRGEVLTGSHMNDTVLLRRDGTGYVMNMSGAPILDEEDRIQGAVLVSRDITERRNLELRTREALVALLAMTQIIGHGFENINIIKDQNQDQTVLTTQEIAKRMAELTRDFLGCQRLSISVFEPDTAIMRPLAVVGLTQDQEQQWWKEQQRQESRLADSPDQSIVQPLQANEVVLLDMTQPPWNAYPNPYGIKTMLIAPMSTGDRLAGLLTLDYGGAEHQYTSEELELAGAAANLVGTIIEREQLLRQQAELLTNNKRMAELIELAHDAIIVRTPESIIVSWNQGAERLYGWTAQEAYGHKSHEFLQTYFPFPHSREVTDNLLSLHGQWEGQITHTCRDGTQVIVESRQVILREESGQPTAILEINRDITERDRIQREREEARANELALRQANQRMDEFLGIVSHELRTPLTTIKGNVQLARFRLRKSLQEVPENLHDLKTMLEEIYMMLDRAERQANVQNRMVSDLLDISRLQADKLELRLVLCDLAALVLETVEDQRSTTLKRAIYLEMPEGECTYVIADPERISQVLSNFITNALKYSQEGHPVFVRLQNKENKAWVSVQDEGPGLTDSEQEQIWDRFYQVQGIKRQRGSSVGLGLGLHISRAIIEQHQGQIGVESMKGEGSTFWFTLPFADADGSSVV